MNALAALYVLCMNFYKDLADDPEGEDDEYKRRHFKCLDYGGTFIRGKDG